MLVRSLSNPLFGPRRQRLHFRNHFRPYLGWEMLGRWMNRMVRRQCYLEEDPLQELNLPEFIREDLKLPSRTVVMVFDDAAATVYFLDSEEEVLGICRKN